MEGINLIKCNHCAAVRKLGLQRGKLPLPAPLLCSKWANLVQYRFDNRQETEPLTTVHVEFRESCILDFVLNNMANAQWRVMP